VSGEARFKCGGCGSVSDRRRSRHDRPLDRTRHGVFFKGLFVGIGVFATAFSIDVATGSFWHAMAATFALVTVYWIVELET
jgi:hypothetical protein